MICKACQTEHNPLESCGVARRKRGFAARHAAGAPVMVTAGVTQSSKVTGNRHLVTQSSPAQPFDVTLPVTGFVLPPVLDAMARTESTRLGLSVEEWIGKVFRQPLKPTPVTHAERQAAYRDRAKARTGVVQ